MKAILLVATLASLTLSFSAPLQASTSAPVFSLEQLLDSSVDRHGRGCDNPKDIAEHPYCTKA